jgi:hypothetical protein
MLREEIELYADTGYQGLHKIHENTILPNKKKRNVELSTEQKKA